jgi:hypothetical protein
MITPVGVHDDRVISVAMAVMWALQRPLQERGEYVIVPPGSIQKRPARAGLPSLAAELRPATHAAVTRVQKQRLPPRLTPWPFAIGCV